jgi:hypothetical protein
MYFVPPGMFDSVTLMSPTLSDCPVADMISHPFGQDTM